MSAAAGDSRFIDLSCDVGEGFGTWSSGDDAAVIPLVTSASVACGFHAGDPVIMRRLCYLASEHGVSIGAHVGYRDLAGFGRREIAVPPDVVHGEVLYQFGALEACARAAGARVSFLKPHGALYHRAADDDDCAAAIVDAASAMDPDLAVLGPPRSRLLHRARDAGLTAVPEAFVDRAYARDGRLVPREAPDSCLEHEAAVAQAVELATRGRTSTATGERVAVTARSLCIHGDGQRAVQLAAAVRDALLASGVQIVSFS